MRRADIGPALLGLAGVAVVARPSALLGGAGLPVVGVAAGLAGAVFSGAAYTTVRRLTRTEDPLVIVFYFSWISVVGALVPALRNWVPPTAGEVAALVVIGLVTQAGQVLITWGLRAERAGRAASAGYLQIVFAAGWGALLFGQLPDAWTLAGAALVVVA
ncbi:MAG: EamA family transporter, partial [Gemmatimonadetes bacterium]